MLAQLGRQLKKLGEGTCSYCRYLRRRRRRRLEIARMGLGSHSGDHCNTQSEVVMIGKCVFKNSA
jgi:hypothetical protein